MLYSRLKIDLSDLLCVKTKISCKKDIQLKHDYNGTKKPNVSYYAICTLDMVTCSLRHLFELIILVMMEE